MIERLTPRDRIALAIGAAAVAAALIYFAGILPFQGALKGLDARIASRQRQVGEVRALQSRYLQLQRELGQAEQRLAKGGQLSLGSFVEEVVHRYAAKDNLVGMRPQPANVQGDLRQETVEVQLEKVRLGQVVQILYAIDNAPAYLKIQNLRIKTRFDDRTLVDAVLTVAAYRRGA
jgi:general secretion pathway protein M